VLDLNLLDTEGINENSMEIDAMSTLDILKTINDEDKKVALTIEEVLPDIERAIEAIYSKVKNEGRIVYIGAGTSGRLGVLDASECPPTFGVEPTMVTGVIAGGIKALYSAIEGAEDDANQAIDDLKAISFSKNDVLVGLAASGRTPYVLRALEYANDLGSVTVSISCVKQAEISAVAKFPIEAVVGSEIVTGSTRMKAGTAQKLILNMISTTIMIKLGKVYGNLMVDVKATNEKLKIRAKNIIEMATGLEGDEAQKIYEESGFSVKNAIVMEKTGLGKDEALNLLNENEGRISNVLRKYKKKRGN